MHALLQRALVQVLPDPTLPGSEALLESMAFAAVAARLSAPDYLHLVACHDGRLQGYIALRDGSHLYHLFVDPLFQQHGVARLLWQALLNASGATRVTVNSSLLAVPVYQRFGFVVDGAPQVDRVPACQPMLYQAGRQQAGPDQAGLNQARPHPTKPCRIGGA